MTSEREPARKCYGQLCTVTTALDVAGETAYAGTEEGRLYAISLPLP